MGHSTFGISLTVRHKAGESFYDGGCRQHLRGTEPVHSVHTAACGAHGEPTSETNTVNTPGNGTCLLLLGLSQYTVLLMYGCSSRGRSHPSPDSAGPVLSALSQQPQTSNSHSAHILQHCTDIFAIMQFKCTLVIPTSNSNSVDTWWSGNSIPISRAQPKLGPQLFLLSTHPHYPFSTSTVCQSPSPPLLAI